jgi:hypothetical protein
VGQGDEGGLGMNDLVEDEIDLTPDPHVLFSMMNTKMPWWQALAELIDNSFEAGATRVEIVNEKHLVKVIDDGRGVTDVTACFRYGDHRQNDRDGISQYGVGAKDVWYAWASTMRITTVHNGIKTVAEGNCEKMAGKKFKMQAPVSHPTDEPSGTTIELHLRSGKKGPSEEAFEAVRWRFTPGLRSGRQIVTTKVKNKGRASRSVLSAVEMPLLTDVVESAFDIDGKSVWIRIGILADGHKMPNGNGPLWIIRKHRVIDANSLGIGPYSARRIGGEVHIGKEWKLAKHKDSLTENADRLEEAIHVRIRGILEKADQLAETFDCLLLRNRVQTMLDDAIGGAQKKKESRGKGETIGSIAPKHSGRERLRAIRTSDAEGKISVRGKSNCQSKRGVVFDWIELEGERIGNVDATGKRISLNVNNAYVASLKSNGDCLQTFLLVAALIADHDCRHESNGQKLLAFDFGDFAEAMGAIVKDYKEVSDNEQNRAV